MHLCYEVDTPVVLPEVLYPARHHEESSHDVAALSLLKSSAKLPKLYGDARRFRSVLTQLVKNALKFTRFSGKIAVRACYEEGKLVCNVQDSGKGIAPEGFPTLFSRFGKLQRTAEMNNEGIGLGLTLAK